jgi:lipopolysaccharide export system protein LptA
MAYQAQSELAKRLGTQAPALPTSHDIATIASAQFEYSGSATQGTLTLPQPFTMESKAVGKSGDKSFDQTMTAEGSQATIQLDPASAGKVPFQTGKISGPVKLKILRSETAGTQPPTLSELNGSADMVEFDLTTSRTITLKGNVKVSGSSGLYQGTSEGDTVVVSLDENMKPIKIRITGDPTKSTLRERKPGGGR